MNTKSTTELYNKFMELVEAGDEATVKAFLVENINEFPEDVKKKIVFEFFSDGLDKTVESATLKTQIQKEGLDSIKEIEKVEKNLNDEKKVIDVRSSLNL